MQHKLVTHCCVHDNTKTLHNQASETMQIGDTQASVQFLEIMTHPRPFSAIQSVDRPECLSYRRESRPLRLSVTGRQTTSIHSVT